MHTPRTLVRWLAASLAAIGSFNFAAQAQPTRALVNLSVRTDVGPGNNAAIISFQIEGAVPKGVLIRAIGPTLGNFGIPNALSDPQLTVHDATGATIAADDDWGGDPAVLNAMMNVGAFFLSPTSKDAAIVLTLAPGTYSVRVTGVGGSAGTALLEVYDTTSDPRLSYLGGTVNVSSSAIGLAGVVVNAPAPQTILVRALGPALGDPHAASDPTLTLFSGPTAIATNDDWGSLATNPAIAAAADLAGLRPLADGSADAAVLATVSGQITAQITAKSGGSGLVAYEVAQIDGDRAALVAPALLAPPSDQVASAGVPFAISALALGRPYPTFQWSKDGAPLAGATNSALAFPNPEAADAGTYTVTMTNAAGAVTSVPWNLAVAAPAFQTITVNTGESIDFTTGSHVQNTGGGDLYFLGNQPQFWANNDNQRGLVSLGATAVALTDVLPPFGGYSRFGVPVVAGNTYVSWLRSGAAGEFVAFKVTAVSATSVTLQYVVVPTVAQPLSIRLQPTAPFGQVPIGAYAQLDVGAIGPAPLTYQWRKNGGAIVGATNASLVLSSVSPSDAGDYDVVVTSPSGSAVSSSTSLLVMLPNVPPSVTFQPQPITTAVGSFAVFFVGFSGTTPMSFQWRHDGLPVPGATASFLIFPAVTAADAGDYDVVLTNAAGSATSNPAHLTVLKAHATVTLGNLEQSYDGAPKPVTVTTSPAGLNVTVAYNGSSVAPTAVGTYDVHATVDDANYDGGAVATLVIRDTTPPVISSIHASPDIINVPNHKMVPVTIVVVATDDVDAHPGARIVSVSSNEPANGTGDGNTAVDWEITGDLSLNLRAERSGNGSGRLYTIVVEVRDAAGNTSTAATTVTVPKGK